MAIKRAKHSVNIASVCVKTRSRNARRFLCHGHTWLYLQDKCKKTKWKTTGNTSLDRNCKYQSCWSPTATQPLLKHWFSLSTSSVERCIALHRMPVLCFFCRWMDTGQTDRPNHLTPTHSCGNNVVCSVRVIVHDNIKLYMYVMHVPFIHFHSMIMLSSDCQEEVFHSLHPFIQAPPPLGVLLSDALSISCSLPRHSRYNSALYTYVAAYNSLHALTGELCVHTVCRVS